MEVKRDKKGRFLKGTPPPNPKGRPKDEESWAGIIRAIGDMYPEDILEFIPKNNDLGRMMSKLPKAVQMKYLVTARVYASLLFEPSSGLLNALMDRVDGKVVQGVDMTSRGEKVESITDEGLNRAISTFYDAIRKTVSGQDAEE